MALRNAFTYSRRITFDTSATGAATTGDITSFPVTVHINAASWPDPDERTAFFCAANVAGKRVEFYDPDGTELDYIVVEYDSTAQTARYLIRVPTLTANATTDYIHLGYGNDPNGSAQDDTANTLVGYGAFWPAGDNYLDGSLNAISVSGSFNMTNTGCTDNTDAVRPGWAQDGSADYQTDADGAVTIEALSFWHKNPSENISASTGPGTAFDFGVGSLMFSSGTILLTNEIVWLQQNTAGPTYWRTAWCHATDNIASGAWHHIAIRWNSTDSRYDIIIDNAVKTVVSGGSGHVAKLTSSALATATNALGEFSDLRASSSSRSLDWMKAEYISTKGTNWQGEDWITWGLPEKSLTTDAPFKALLTKRISSENPLGYSCQRNVCRGSDGTEYVAVVDNYPASSVQNIKVWMRKPIIGLWEPLRDSSGNDRSAPSASSSRVQQGPSLAIDSSNNLHLVFHGPDATYTARYRVRYCKFTQSTGTWAAQELLSDSGDYPALYPTICVGSDDTVHAAWYGQDAATSGKYNPRYRRYSGGSWGSIVAVQSDTSANWYYVALCLGPSNYPHMAYTDNSSKMRYATSTDFTSFSTEDVSTSATSAAFPSIVHNGTYPTLVWAHVVSGTQQIMWSNRSGGSWAAAATVSAVPASAQASPSLGIDSLGRYVCAFTIAFPTNHEVFKCVYESGWGTKTRISTGTLTAKSKAHPHVRWAYNHANGLDNVTVLFSEGNRAANTDANYDYVWHHEHIAKVGIAHLSFASEDYIASTTNLTRTFTAPTKYASNPAVPKGSAGRWNQDRTYGLTSVQVGASSWYGYAIGANGSTFSVGRYLSTDGIVWTEDSANNPIMKAGADRDTPRAPGSWDYALITAGAVYYDPTAATGYKFAMSVTGAPDLTAAALYQGGMAYSEDGLAWMLYTGTASLHDPLTGAGDAPVTVFAPSGGTDDFFYYQATPGDVEDLSDDAPDAAHRYVMTFQAWQTNVNAVRRIGAAYSADRITWVKYPVCIAEGDDGGWTPGAAFDQVHGAETYYDRGRWLFRYEAFYAGSPSKTNSQHARASRLSPGIANLAGDVLIPLGTSGTWDDTAIYSGPVVTTGDTTRYWYAGNDGGTPNLIQTGYSSITYDQEVGYRANAASATLTTKPFVQPYQKSLGINLSGMGTGDKVEVELLDLTGSPITGYTQTDADDLTTNNIAHTVTWGGGASLPMQDFSVKVYITKSGGTPQVNAITLDTNLVPPPGIPPTRRQFVGIGA